MMTHSVREDLKRDPDCLDLLDRIYQLNERDQMVFQLLQQEEGRLTVDDVANRLECERTTAYRSFSRLRDAGIIVQEQDGVIEPFSYFSVDSALTDLNLLFATLQRS